MKAEVIFSNLGVNLSLPSAKLSVCDLGASLLE